MRSLAKSEAQGTVAHAGQGFKGTAGALSKDDALRVDGLTILLRATAPPGDRS